MAVLTHWTPCLRTARQGNLLDSSKRRIDCFLVGDMEDSRRVPSQITPQASPAVTCGSNIMSNILALVFKILAF